MQMRKLKVFISHAWEGKPFAMQLEEELKSTIADVWVDHSGIRGGDNLPKEISDALEWCDTLLLIWSERASKSRWVELEIVRDIFRFYIISSETHSKCTTSRFAQTVISNSLMTSRPKRFSSKSSQQSAAMMTF
jgi:hypothetical protein